MAHRKTPIVGQYQIKLKIQHRVLMIAAVYCTVLHADNFVFFYRKHKILIAFHENYTSFTNLT